MCPQNRDNKLYDDQGYYDSYYEYGGGYNKDDKCTDGGKWKCCNPDESLTGLKAWVRNCQVSYFMQVWDVELSISLSTAY